MISLETNKDNAIMQRTNMINDNWHGGRRQDKQSCDPSQQIIIQHSIVLS